MFLVVKALLELDVLVPKGMRQEVLTAAFCATLEKPKNVRSPWSGGWQGAELGKGRWRRTYCKRKRICTNGKLGCAEAVDEP